MQLHCATAICILLSLLNVDGQLLKRPSSANDVNGREPNTSARKECTTPEGDKGMCQPLSSCPSFTETFKRGPNPEFVEHLRKGLCHYEEASAIICCPVIDTPFVGTDREPTVTKDSLPFGPDLPNRPSLDSATRPFAFKPEQPPRHEGSLDRPSFSKPQSGRPLPNETGLDRPSFNNPVPFGPSFTEAPRRDRPVNNEPRLEETPLFSGPRPDIPSTNDPRPDRTFPNEPRPERPLFLNPPSQDFPLSNRPFLERPFLREPFSGRPLTNEPRRDQPFFNGPQPERNFFNEPFPNGPRLERPFPERRPETTFQPRPVAAESSFPSRGISKPLSSNLERASSSCGISIRSSARPNIECNTAERGAWPWLALLGYRNVRGNLEFQCEGALITSRHVLTAAHCVHKRQNLLTVRLGDHDLLIATEAAHEEYAIVKIAIHDDYDSSSLKNDIAILTLRDAITFKNHISPVCLAEQDYFNDKSINIIQTFVAGWSSLANSNISSAILTEVMIPIDANAATRLVSVNSNRLCAYIGGNGVCEGISGGPLVAYNPRKKHYSIVGIISLGFSCSNTQFPGIYTRVTEYLDWIIEELD